MKTSLNPEGDLCRGFLAEVWATGVLTLPPQARVLELGCAETDSLGMLRAARPDLHLTGLDWRTVTRPAADRLIRADALTYDKFMPGEFDAIIAVSMVAWCGIGHYTDPAGAGPDPMNVNGDRLLMQRARQWISPTAGWMYLDVPYDAEQFLLRPAGLRAYNEGAIKARLAQQHWRITSETHFTGDGHPDGPYVALVLRPGA